MSYQKLNQFTRPFKFLIPRCDYAVKDTDTEVKYFITVYMYSGHWKVVMEEEARKRLELSTLDRNRQWRVIPMRALNTAPKFVAMTMKPQMECYILYKERGLNCFNQTLLLMMCYCMGEQTIRS